MPSVFPLCSIHPGITGANSRNTAKWSSHKPTHSVRRNLPEKKISVFKKKNENRDSLLDVTLKYSKKDKACPARCSADKGGCL